MQEQDIIRMTTQIAEFFKPYEHDEALKEIAHHINSFWDPRMRKALLDFSERSGAGLNPLVHAALPLVRKPTL